METGNTSLAEQEKTRVTRFNIFKAANGKTEVKGKRWH